MDIRDDLESLEEQLYALSLDELVDVCHTQEVELYSNSKPLMKEQLKMLGRETLIKVYMNAERKRRNAGM